jgi:hypothetical protein
MYPAFSRITRLLVVVVVLFTTLLASTRMNPVMAQESAVLLEDNFDDNSNGWEMAGTNSKTVEMDVDDGVLSLAVSSDDEGRWSFATPERAFDNDIDVAVDVQATNADDAYWYAALLMRSDMREDSDDKKTEYYHFEITSKGEWGFAARYINEDDDDKLEYKLLKSGKLTKFDSEEQHNLAVSAKGNEFTFTVDGKKVGTFEDDTVNDNDDPKYIGVLAGTLDGEQEVTIEFDNFIVQGEDTGEAGNDSGDDSTVKSGGVLLKDNFKNNDLEWSLTKNDQSSVTMDEENNTLTIQIFEGTKDGWLRGVIPNKVMPSDVDVSVSAVVDDGDSSGKWEYGIGVRYYSQDKTYTYYLLSLTSSDKWVFSSYDGKKSHIIEQGEIKDFDPTKSNKLNIIAVGDKFEFFLNNKKLGESQDDSLEDQSPSYVMLLGTASDEDSSITVNFKNLLVLKP